MSRRMRAGTDNLALVSFNLRQVTDNVSRKAATVSGISSPIRAESARDLKPSHLAGFSPTRNWLLPIALTSVSGFGHGGPPAPPGRRSLTRVLEQIAHLRSIGIDEDRIAAVHPHRVKQLAQGGACLTAQHLGILSPTRRRAILIVTVIETSARRILLQKNDTMRQMPFLVRMIFTVPQIIAHLSEFVRVMPGDVILTGTPNGVAYSKPEPDYLRPGDLLHCGIEGSGKHLPQVVH